MAPEQNEAFSDIPVGATMGDLGDRLLQNDQRIPLEPMPKIEENIQHRIEYWYIERTKPYADIALCNHKINCLSQAKDHVREAYAGMLTAHGAIHEYIAGTAIHGSL
jgi:hypothetical protein